MHNHNGKPDFCVTHSLTEEGALNTTIEDLAIALAKEIPSPLGHTDITGASFVMLHAHDKQDECLGFFMGAAINASPKSFGLMLANVIAGLRSYVKDEQEQKECRALLTLALGQTCSDMMEGLELGSLLMAASCKSPNESDSKP